MKSQNKPSKKIVASIIAAIFCFSQVLPTTFAGGFTVGRGIKINKSPQQVPTRSLPDASAQQQNEIPAPVVPVDPTAEFLGGVSAISSTTDARNDESVADPVSNAREGNVSEMPEVEETVTVPELPALGETMPLLEETADSESTEQSLETAADIGLSISIDSRSIATVTWNGQTYKGYLDSRTNCVTIITNDDAILTLQFAVGTNGENYLQEFSEDLANGEWTEYEFNEQGEIVATTSSRNEDENTDPEPETPAYPSLEPGVYENGRIGTPNGTVEVRQEYVYPSELGGYRRVNFVGIYNAGGVLIGGFYTVAPVSLEQRNVSSDGNYLYFVTEHGVHVLTLVDVSSHSIAVPADAIREQIAFVSTNRLIVPIAGKNPLYINIAADGSLTFDAVDEIPDDVTSHPLTEGAAYDVNALTGIPSAAQGFAMEHHEIWTDKNPRADVHVSNVTGTSFDVHADVVAGEWVAITIDWGFHGAADLGDSVTLALSGTEGRVLKIEVEDWDGVKAIYYVRLTAAKQNYTFDISELGDIKGIIFVGEYEGVLDYKVEWAEKIAEPTNPGFPTISADANLTAGDVSILTTQSVYSIVSEGSTASLNQETISIHEMQINLADSGWAATLFNFDDYGTEPKESIDLSGVANITLGLMFNNNTSARVKVEFEDVNGNKSIVYLENVGLAEQFFSILNANIVDGGNEAFDITRVRNINVVVEKDQLSIASDTLNIRFGLTANGAQQPGISEVYPNANLSVGSVTDLLDGSAHINVIVNAPDTATFQSLQNGVYELTYGVAGVEGELAPGVYENGKVGTPIGDLTVTIEVLHTDYIHGHWAYDRNVNFYKPDGTLIATIREYVNGDAADLRQSNFNWNQEQSVLYFKGSLVLASSFKGWAAGWISYERFGTPETEVRDLSALDEIVVGLAFAEGSGDAKLEIEDADDNKAVVYLRDIGTTEQFYSVPTDLFENQGIDLTRIRNVLFVVSGDSVSEDYGQLLIRLAPTLANNGVVIQPSANLTAADVTNLVGDAVSANVIANEPVTGSFAAESATYYLRYDLVEVGASEENWIAGWLNYDDFGTAGTIESKDLTGLDSIVVGLQYGNNASGDVKFEVEDTNHNKAAVCLANVAASGVQFYEVALSILLEANPNLDLTQITSILFVIEAARVNKATGDLRVEAGTIPEPEHPLTEGAEYDVNALTAIPSSVDDPAWHNPQTLQTQGVASAVEGATTATVNVVSTAAGFSAQSQVNKSGEFTFTNINWGYYTPDNWSEPDAVWYPVPTTTLGDSLTLALSGTEGRKLKVEIKNGDEVLVYHVILTADAQNYTFDISSLDAVTNIIFVSDEVGQTNYTVEYNNHDEGSVLGRYQDGKIQTPNGIVEVRQTVVSHLTTTRVGLYDAEGNELISRGFSEAFQPFDGPYNVLYSLGQNNVSPDGTYLAFPRDSRSKLAVFSLTAPYTFSDFYLYGEKGIQIASIAFVSANKILITSDNGKKTYVEIGADGTVTRSAA